MVLLIFLKIGVVGARSQRACRTHGSVAVSLIPIVRHHQPAVSSSRIAWAEEVAIRLREEHPEFAVKELFQPLVVDHLSDEGTVHLDDLSAIPGLDRFYDVTFLEDRARLRAGDGDFVVSCSHPVPRWERYCREHLGLGSVAWLHPEPKRNPLCVAAACWTDRDVRRTLIGALRSGKLRYLHPHLGSFPVWAAAALLQRASRRPLKVIAPPPGLTQRVNDKVWFAKTVRRLFGAESVPWTASAHNPATVAALVREVAPITSRVVIKLPDSAGGAGNLVFDSSRFRNRSLGEIRRDLKEALPDFIWSGERVLVACWETEVLYAPSAQLWVPSAAEGPPVVEGVFEQLLEGPEGLFAGSRPATLPVDLVQQIVDRSWLLGYLFQRLGYLGRCSFDLLLVGANLASSRLEFIECNGRWGGTSAPMTLMNRVFGDFRVRPYAARKIIVPHLDGVSFADVLEYLGADLFDIRTGAGDLILYSPAVNPSSGMQVLALADSWEAATRRINSAVPLKLKAMVDGSAVEPA